MEVKKDENSFLQNMKHENNQKTKEEEEENEILKKRISSHPLYGLLLHSHLSCLKVCSGDFDSPEIMNTVDGLALTKLSLHSDSPLEATTSELDQFMIKQKADPVRGCLHRTTTQIHHHPTLSLPSPTAAPPPEQTT
ncbi:hypothetical protein F2Q68_00013416 [Brassica cretica]|uniref:KNOX1 domain-containing protein n=1 Tax=Brassica cretica TaxID=69181 RepID=A0A8S9HL30_BRACR|nr:hypothetical protein F2Q68_00013416 [Brassica cretica]